MNIQAMMKQAQKLQNDMMKAKNEIDAMEFHAQNGFVEVILNGKKEVKKVNLHIDDSLEKEDINLLEDMVMIAINDAMQQIDKITEEKLGKFTNGMPNLF